jgi:hypothetical protein
LWGCKFWVSALKRKSIYRWMLYASRRQLVDKFPVFYGTRRFIAVFVKSHHCNLSNQSTPSHTIHLRSILILSSYMARFQMISILLRSGERTTRTIIFMYIIFSSIDKWEPGKRSWYSDWLRAGRQRGRSSSPSNVKNFFSSPSRPDRLWGPRNLQTNGYREPLLRG